MLDMNHVFHCFILICTISFYLPINRNNILINKFSYYAYSTHPLSRTPKGPDILFELTDLEKFKINLFILLRIHILHIYKLNTTRLKFVSFLREVAIDVPFHFFLLHG